MPVVEFKIKQGDTRPRVETNLANADLANAAGVWFQMRLKTRRGMPRPKPIRGLATVVDVATGLVRYNWTAIDTEVPGLYDAEWQVTYLDGSVLTFPNQPSENRPQAYHIIEVIPQVA